VVTKSIEIITFTGCRTARDLIDDLEKARQREDFELTVTLVPSADRAAEMGLYGSPTILINNELYQSDGRENPGFY
jgi:2-hydroxychromene-2-carboxylate isomerase